MIRCLSCAELMPEDKAHISHEVMVCSKCKSNIDGFVRALAADLRFIDNLSSITLRKALLQGEFKKDWGASAPLDRLGLLVGLMQEIKPCPSSSTPLSLPSSPSSGEPLPPHASTLTALAAGGRKSSNSPTE